VSHEATSSALSNGDVELPPIGQHQFSQIASQHQQREPSLPRLQSVILPRDYPRVSSLLSSTDGDLPGYSTQREYLDASGNPPPGVYHHWPAHTAPRLTPLSPHGQSEAEDEWLTFYFEELRHNCFQVSQNRPPYTTDAQNNESNEDVEISLYPKNKPVGFNPQETSKLDGITTDEIKAKKRAEHAEAERTRRDRHKRSLVQAYLKVSDYALSKAGWDLNSTRAPTKEKIMIAANIHQRMLTRLIELIFKHDYDHASHPLEPHQGIGLSRATSDENFQPYRTTEGARYQQVLVQQCSMAKPSAIGHVEFPSPNRSLSSLSESFYSTESGHTKRKREEDDDEETTPTGPLRHAAAKQSPYDSPRSANSSLSSWCLVEKQI
jgi:hypothetical protein